jgi:hypothetical protein
MECQVRQLDAKLLWFFFLWKAGRCVCCVCCVGGDEVTRMSHGKESERSRNAEGEREREIDTGERARDRGMPTARCVLSCGVWRVACGLWRVALLLCLSQFFTRLYHAFGVNSLCCIADSVSHIFTQKLLMHAALSD